MSRCLHLTINERCDALPQEAASPSYQASYQAGLDNSDPESNYIIPPPIGGGWNDPSAGEGGTGPEGGSSSSTRAEGTAHACSCSCTPPPCQSPAAGAGSKDAPLFVAEGDYSGFVIVRLHEGVVGESLAETLWDLAERHSPKLTGLQAVLAIGLPAPPPGPVGPVLRPVDEPEGVLRSRPLVEINDPEVECGGPLSREETLRVLRDLEREAATSPFKPLRSLTAYWRVDLRDHTALAGEVVTRLHRLAEVDLAYRELRANDPGLTVGSGGTAFAEDQGYLEAAPLGVGASWAWKNLSATARKVNVCDLEQGWNLEHDDLVAQKYLRPVLGANRSQDEASPGHHGTAVLGQLAEAGTGNQYVKGASAQVGEIFLSSHYRGQREKYFPATNGHVAGAIVQTLLPVASPRLGAGDVLLLEVQRGLLPVEVDEANFDAIRLASARSVIVVEAAGNGGFDLDRWREPGSGRSLRLGSSGFEDSGAILVGAASSGLPHERMPFSNYGSRLDCYSWGETVTTCGFGDLAGTGARDFYTNRFNGTSSASPVIAGVAALLQSLQETSTGRRLEPWVMRALLRDPATGTPQGPNVPGHIGVMPNLEAIVRDALQLVPDVYLRRSICDRGRTPGPDEEISSSPDIFVSRGPGAIQSYGEGSGRENQPAPGRRVRPGQINRLYVRLRNRGSGVGGADLQLFASPAATLVTPECWIPLGQLKPSPANVPQGDTLSVAGPLPWKPGAPERFWSFLAILSEPGQGPSATLVRPYYDWALGLPPGGKYFDWKEYRAFLRQSGVVCRNTHRVASGSTHSLDFVIAGTPDQARSFDFEVLQRLPEGTKVGLDVGPALQAKLLQRQSLTNALSQQSPTLSLPKQSRTTFHHLQLAAGARAGATFHVSAGSVALEPGHSLALRQLWHGEEVGRITWYFGLAR